MYGAGLTRLLVVPLPPREAADLDYRLQQAGARRSDGQSLLRVGPLGALVTRSRRAYEVRWLVTGTVTDETLLDAAADLATGARPR